MKKTRDYTFTLSSISLILALILSACSSWPNFGSGTIVSEKRSVKDFDNIYMRGEGTVYLSQGEEVSVVVETDDNLVSGIYTEVKGRTLDLRYTSGFLGTHLRPTQGTIYHITVPELESITISGSGIVFADGVVVERLDLDVTGSGQFHISDLSAEELSVDITGSGMITLSGDADTQRISVTGNGTFDGRNLEGRTVEVSNTGSGLITVWATVAFDVSIEGNGKVQYYGDVVPNISNSLGNVVSLSKP